MTFADPGYVRSRTYSPCAHIFEEYLPPPVERRDLNGTFGHVNSHIFTFQDVHAALIAEPEGQRAKPLWDEQAPQPFSELCLAVHMCNSMPVLVSGRPGLAASPTW
jgi:hypothetical protein